MFELGMISALAGAYEKMARDRIAMQQKPIVYASRQVDLQRPLQLGRCAYCGRSRYVDDRRCEGCGATLCEQVTGLLPMRGISELDALSSVLGRPGAMYERDLYGKLQAAYYSVSLHW